MISFWKIYFELIFEVIYWRCEGCGALFQSKRSFLQFKNCVVMHLLIMWYIFLLCFCCCNDYVFFINYTYDEAYLILRRQNNERSNEIIKKCVSFVLIIRIKLHSHACHGTISGTTDRHAKISPVSSGFPSQRHSSEELSWFYWSNPEQLLNEQHFFSVIWTP